MEAGSGALGLTLGTDGPVAVGLNDDVDEVSGEIWSLSETAWDKSSMAGKAKLTVEECAEGDFKCLHCEEDLVSDGAERKVGVQARHTQQ